MDSTITDITAREILDSRGNPTVEVDLMLKCGQNARAAVPAGASLGSREAIESRDNDPHRYDGKGVIAAVSHIMNTIRPAIIGLDATRQETIDNTLIELDGTRNKSKLGANAILAVSLACARAAANMKKMPLYRYLGGPDVVRLPVPMMNILNGGLHTHEQGADFQEYMIAPYGAGSFQEALRWGAEIYHALLRLLVENNMSVGVGDEGGFAPHIRSNREPLDLIMSAIVKAGRIPGSEVGLAIDAAASTFYRDGQYKLRTENRVLSSNELVEYYQSLVHDYPLCLLEDGLSEDDWSGWKVLNSRLGTTMELVGDDIFCTNPTIITRGITEDIANSVLIKPNQIGTLTETLAATRLAQSHGWGAFVW